MSGSQPPTVHIKRVYEPPHPHDGTRVLVDRLWPRGLAKSDAAVDRWLKEIAPSHDLRRWFGHDPAKWEPFKILYLSELVDRDDQVETLAQICRRGPTTLLFAAKDEQRNNAVALRDLLLRRHRDHRQA